MNWAVAQASVVGFIAEVCFLFFITLGLHLAVKDHREKRREQHAPIPQPAPALRAVPELVGCHHAVCIRAAIKYDNDRTEITALDALYGAPAALTGEEQQG